MTPGILAVGSSRTVSPVLVSIFNIFPEGLIFTLYGMTAEDDRVALEAESHGVHKSGKQYNNHYHFLFRIRDGKIAEIKEYADTAHARDVLG